MMEDPRPAEARVARALEAQDGEMHPVLEDQPWQGRGAGRGETTAPRPESSSLTCTHARIPHIRRRMWNAPGPEPGRERRVD